MSNISSTLHNLTDEALLDMYNALLDADIRRLNGKDARKVLKRMEGQSRGKVKKIYAAFRKAKNLEQALDIFYQTIQ